MIDVVLIDFMLLLAPEQFTTRVIGYMLKVDEANSSSAMIRA